MTDHQAKAITRDSLIRYYGIKSSRSGNLIKVFKIIGDELYVWHGWNLKWRKIPLSSDELEEDRRIEPVGAKEAHTYERLCANRLLKDAQDWLKDNPE